MSAVSQRDWQWDELTLSNALIIVKTSLSLALSNRHPFSVSMKASKFGGTLKMSMLSWSQPVDDQERERARGRRV